MELMHHYTTSTSLTLSLPEHMDIQQLWQHQIPHEAQAHPFLLHGMLGITALHLSHLHGQNDRDYHIIAGHHHAKASKTFQVAVANVNVENCTAVFSFSLIMTLVQFDLSFSSGLLQQEDHFDSLIAAISVLRGSWCLTMQYRPVIEQGSLGVLLTRHRNVVKGTLDQETAAVLNNLETINQSTTETKEVKATNSEAIQKLHHWYSMVSPVPNTWAHIIHWPATLSPEYFALLQQKQPRALIIVAHWCVPVHRAPYRWFVEGWAKRAVRVIAQSLDGGHALAMMWPLTQVLGS